MCKKSGRPMAARPESAALALPVGGVDEIKEAGVPLTEITGEADGDYDN